MDPYPELFDKAAFLWHRIASGHIFHDGNKRTATVAATAFLQLNGYAIEASQDELVNLTIAMATKEVQVEEVTTWISKRASLKERDTWPRPSDAESM